MENTSNGIKLGDFRVWVRATKYSLSFAFRHAPVLTSVRLGLMIVSAILLFFLLRLIEWTLNSFQSQFAGESETMFGVSVLLLSIAVFLLCHFFMGLVDQIDNYLGRWWSAILELEQNFKIVQHKAGLDLAVRKSQKFADLEEEIRSIPGGGWYATLRFSDNLSFLLRMVLSFIAFASTIFLFNPIYVLVLFGASVPLLKVRFWAINKEWEQNKELVPMRKEQEMLENSISNVGTLSMAKHWGQLPFVSHKIRELANNVYQRNIVLQKRILIKTIIPWLALSLAVFGILYHSTYDGVIAVGGFSVLLSSVQSCSNYLRTITEQITKQCLSAGGIILLEEQFFQLKPMVMVADDPVPLNQSFQELSFENVSFHYPNDNNQKVVIKNFNNKVRFGERIAVVGANGACKSTIMSLMMRNYDPVEGSIAVNGIDLRSVVPADWYREIVYLGQKDSENLNARSLKEEIASSVLSQPIDEDLVWQVLRIVKLEEEIKKLPEKLETQLGENFGGIDLSGGQRQRLALARSFYRVFKLRSSIFVCDELDTGMDGVVADEIMRELFSMDDLTIIMVTHNLGKYLSDCDRVWFFMAGELSGDGSHDFLLQENDNYRNLVEKDRQRRVSEPSTPIAAAEAE